MGHDRCARRDARCEPLLPHDDVITRRSSTTCWEARSTRSILASSLAIPFHGHAGFVLEADGRRIVIDPFLTGNPAADIPVDRLPQVDAALLSPRHGGH